MNSALYNIESSLIREMNTLANSSSINLGIGQINLPPKRTTINSIAQNLEQEGVFAYTSTSGFERLRELVAESYSSRHSPKHNVNYSKDQVLITAGATSALTVSFIALLGKDRTNVVIPEISYPVYDIIPTVLGQGNYEIRRFKLNREFTPDFNDLESKLDDSSLLVLNFPSNPTGATLTTFEARTLGCLIKSKNVIAISDEVYDGITPDNANVSNYASDNIIRVNSLSKSGLIPGMRIGWVVSPRMFVSHLTKVHQYTNSCVNSLAQKAAINVLEHPDQFNELTSFLKTQEKLLNDFLDSKGLKYSSGAIYSFVNISHKGDSLDVAKRIAREANVITIPGKAFGPAGDTHIRISYALPSDLLREGIKRLDRFF